MEMGIIMKKFIKKIAIFGVLLIGLSFLFVVFEKNIVGSQYSQGYCASLIDKVERLESITEPKIILVGNSNLSFGIDSEMIEQAIGMPVVNLGLHGGLGNAFHEEIAKLGIRQGDIVVVCHTNYSDDDSMTDSELAWMAVEWNPELWKIIRKEDYRDMLKAMPIYMLKSTIMWATGTGNQGKDGVYSREAFNQYGDVIYSRLENTYEFTATSVVVPEINNVCIARLNELNEYVKEKGATMVVAGYPIADCEYTPEKDEYRTFQIQLADSLTAPVISDFCDYFIPSQYFYDTNFHLTSEGVKVRTKQLLEDINAYLDKN